MNNRNNRGPAEQANNFTQMWKDLFNYIRPYRLYVGIALIFSIIGTIFTIIGPDKISEITDYITAGIMTSIDLEAIAKVGMFLVFIYGLGALLNFLQGIIMATITQRVTQNLRTDIAKKLDVLPLKYFDGTTYGDVLSRVTNDVDMVGQSLNQSIVSLVTAVTQFVGALIMMLSTNVWMTVAAILSTIIGFVLMMVIMGRSQKYFVEQQASLGSMNGHIEEIYSAHNVVKVYNGEGQAKAEFTEINETLKESSWKSQFFSGMMMPIMNFIGNFGYVAVSVTGAVLVVNGKISFGVIVAFMLYIRFFTQPLSQIAQAATSLQSTAAAGERVFELLNESELASEADKTTVLENVTGDVEFRNVKFGYDEDVTIINDFSVHAKAGQKIAIVGPTGAGKTTMVNLLMRFYEIDSGEILIDGVPTSDITRENLHDLFCMVLQDTWLFEGTIRENIVFNKEGVTDEEVIAASKAVGLHHFVQTLPNGYDSILNDKTSLSTGQKQLLTIARAIVLDAPLLILDEATSSVDTRTEVLIQEAMDVLMKGRTSFVIAHRLSTIKNADLILVMKDGDIIESGTHDELLAEDGFYAELYNSQFDEEAFDVE